jgi:CheY-like chemotaxis protein
MTTPSESATILVVDDDRDPREIASRLLEKAGYRASARLRRRRLHIVDTEPVDLILLDVMMPGWTGSRCARRSTPAASASRSSSYGEGRHGYPPRGHAPRVSEFLTKPINKVGSSHACAPATHLDLARQLETVETNLQAIRPPGHLPAPERSARAALGRMVENIY